MIKKFRELPIGGQWVEADGIYNMKTSLFLVGKERFNSITVNLGSIHEYDPEDINNYASFIEPDYEVCVVKEPMDGINHDEVAAQKFVDYYEKQCQKSSQIHWRQSLHHAKWWLKLIKTPISGAEFDAYDLEVATLLTSMIANRRGKGSGWHDMELQILKWSQGSMEDDGDEDEGC